MNKEYILVIPPSGPCKLVPFDDDIGKHNARIQQLVGGWYEEIACKGRDLIMLADEEGARKGYRINKLASYITKYGVCILGTAVLLKTSVDAEGDVNLAGLTAQEAMDWIINMTQELHTTFTLAFEPSDEGAV